MKISNPVLIGTLSVLGVLTFAIVYPFTLHKGYETMTIKGHTYQLRTARNEAEWARGLMFVEGKQPYDGMVFYFPRKSMRTFWNMNTYSDLELLWMDDDRIIGRSQLPSIKKSKQIVTMTSPGPVNRVVELFKK